MVITSFLSRCLHAEPPVVCGDGSLTRCFAYTGEVTKANQQPLQDDSANDKIINVSSTDDSDMFALAKEVIDTTHGSQNELCRPIRLPQQTHPRRHNEVFKAARV